MTEKLDLASCYLVQQCKKDADAYLWVCCRKCQMHWYLPKDKSRRTKEAGKVLRQHAESH